MEKERTRILIVDDERQNCEIILQILALQDEYSCKAVEDGYKALEIIDDFMPEIILLDIMMPGIDGYEVCRRIRSAEPHKFIKIIMISGMSSIEERLEGYESGADDYITKPFIEDELLAKIAVFSKLARIEEVDILKSTALYLMTHETRTPLNGILLGCEFLKEMKGLPQDAQSYVNIIYKSGKRMHRLVSKINLLCQLKGGVELQQEKRNIEDELLKVIEKAEKKYDKQQITLKSEGDFLLNVDWQLVSKCVWYIVDNACKFGGKMGIVKVTAGKEEDGFFISIKDRGAGLNKETINRIFEGLFSEDILHHKEGSGLSLSVCRLIMIHHSGKLTCDNRAEGGAEFKMIFPLTLVENKTT